MPFLDVLITGTSNCCKICVYLKSTFSGVYSNMNSCNSEVGLIFNLLIRTFFNCFEFLKISSRSMSFKRNIKKNAFPIKLIDSCIKNFFNKKLIEKAVTLTAEKKDLVIALLFLGKLSLDLRTRLKK